MGESLTTYLENYLPIVMFFIIAIGLSVFLVFLNYLRSKSNPDPEKNSPYECGFNAFEDTRHRFDVRFYLIAILFIIFDLEIAFLFPWAISLGKIGLFGFWSMVLFLSILTIGFVYEWKKGALEWE
jgi:NADH-quinone oxidoreductase subunit A